MVILEIHEVFFFGKLVDFTELIHVKLTDE